jgi:serine phosphatase RsbU (regulator of sigma subunit)
MSKPVILCVDDEKIILSSLKEQLRRNLEGDFALEIVESGEEALEVVEELLEDRIELPLVISDHIMPGIKGDELLKEIHRLSPKTLKILLTGQADADAVGNALNNARLYRYIGKPWEEADLVMTVKEATRSYFQDKRLEEQNLSLQNMNQELERLNDELKDYSQTLEQKVDERTRALHESLEKVEEANHKILESIRYAEMIQRSLMPDLEQIKAFIPDSFFLWHPRDIVGGDLYFADVKEQDCLICVVDCTGHGVPGAFMTIIASTGLQKIIKDEGCYEPGEILQRLNRFVKDSLRQYSDEALSDNGMDAAVCLIQPNARRLVFAGANLPLYYSQGGEIQVVKGNRHSLGYKRSDINYSFSNQEIEYHPGMTCYLATDGFLDQLGGERMRRFGTKRFYQLLLEHKEKSLEKQCESFSHAFKRHKGPQEQQDDVTIIGFRV